MNVLFMGGHELGATTLENLILKNINIVGVVITKTNNDWYSGVDKIAEKYNLKLYEEKDINNPEFIDKIKNIDIDLITVVNFEQILKKDIINLPKKGCINTHASLLPKYRGRAPLNWAILNGENEVGVTVHYIEEGIDTGDIILQEKIKVEQSDYISDVLEKVKGIYPKIVYNSVDLVKNDQVNCIKQDLDQGSYFGKRTAEDGQIDIDNSGIEILNMIRALSKPYPGAFIKNDQYHIIIWRAILETSEIEKYTDIEIGKIIKRDENGLAIKLKDSLLIVEEYTVVK